ncbi:MAG TPA: homoserine acetyltransferase, partial [Myxococcaceae bacterium]|nr:homoserine acetyltransferase [Myxococcaceae bacterium]
MTAHRSSAAASPRLFDLRLPPLTLRDGSAVDPHHARVQWWGPETDLPALERMGTQVNPVATAPVIRTAPLRTGTGPRLDPSIPTVLVVHALSGDARAAGPDGWWGPLIGPGRALDPARVRILCANNLGSCYGSSGPLDVGWPQGLRRFTPWDQASAL